MIDKVYRCSLIATYDFFHFRVNHSSYTTELDNKYSKKRYFLVCIETVGFLALFCIEMFCNMSISMI